MENVWVSQGLAFVVGLVSGLIVPPISKYLSRWYHITRSRLEAHPEDFSPEWIQFFALNRWSPDRPLKESDVDVAYDNEAWLQDWCDDKDLQDIRRGLDDDGGPSSTLRSIEVDHRESTKARRLRLVFAPSTYGDLVAVGEYFRRHPDGIDEVLRRLAEDDTDLVVRGGPGFSDLGKRHRHHRRPQTARRAAVWSGAHIPEHVDPRSQRDDVRR